jgi:quercetin dioxygenase-like cupin family protein
MEHRSEFMLNRSELDPSEPFARSGATIFSDNPRRALAFVRSEGAGAAPHIGLNGDTYTILLTGEQTAGRFCLLDVHIPPGGGPPPHRHDFEEAVSLLLGELDVVFRGEGHVLHAGETMNIPANAPHQFHNSSQRPARMLCICAPAGLEKFIREAGVVVECRTMPPTKLDERRQAVLRAKIEALAPKYRIELLDHA